jgi:hypothetical protein
MFVSKYPEWITVLQFQDGSTAFFDGAKDMFKCYYNLAKYRPGQQTRDVRVSGITFLVSVAALISFIAVYFNELPTHHCPFCILQREYGYVGYPLYVTLFSGAICGAGLGWLTGFRRVPSLQAIIPRLQQRLAAIVLISYGIFALLIAFHLERVMS